MKISISLNTSRGGVEIRFTSKPAEEVLQRLKSAGFRWSRASRCWYKKQSAESVRFAFEFAGQPVPALDTAMHEDSCLDDWADRNLGE